MTVMIIGGGGREHAIAWKLKKDNENVKIITVPGNAGIEEISECVNLNIGDISALSDLAIKRKVDYTIIGPEAPLAMGITNLFREKGLKIFGPDKEGAKLEASKIYAKNFMVRHNIPTAKFKIIDTYEQREEFLKNCVYPCVLKYDGLAAGKGVKIVEDKDKAISFLREVFIENLFGVDNKKVLLEDCLQGLELSYLIFTDTKNFIPLVPAKDYKRIFDQDKGLNTGGMGSISPSDVFNEGLESEIKEKIVLPTLNGLASEKIDYRGVLYFGLMITKSGPYVLEYNVRFGDPETQAILPRMESSLIEVINRVIDTKLEGIKINWSNKKSICVIMASEGYPEKYNKGKSITGLNKVKDVILFHAGTKKESNKVVTSGGRVLGVTALAETWEEAREKVYNSISYIDFEGKQYRKDIGVNIR